jgi:hypothetical protein
METPSAIPSRLARQLLAIEAARDGDTGPPVHEVVRVCEKLQVSVTRFAGAEGFNTLLRRALALARADVPAMQAVPLKPGDALEGLRALVADATPGRADVPAAVVAHLLGLLVTFIGEPLTLQLVNDAWPDASLDG